MSTNITSLDLFSSFETYHFLLLDFVVNLLSTFSFACIERRRTKKQINPTLFPSFNKEIDVIPNIDLTGTSLFRTGVAKGIQLSIESMFFASSYGFFVVFLAKWILDIDEKIFYLLICSTIFATLVFMCSFASNGTHIISSHTLHLLYYSFGMVPSALIYPSPGWYYILGACISNLFIGIGARKIAWPTLPQPQQVMPTFSLNQPSPNGNIHLVVHSFPDNTETKSTLVEYWALYYPIENYEILLLHLGSSYGMGGCLALLTSTICFHTLQFDQTTSLHLSLLVSSVWGILYISISYDYFKHKWSSIPLPWAKFTTIVIILLATCSVSIHVTSPNEPNSFTKDGLILVGHTIHLASALLLYIAPFALTGWKFGLLKSTLRCFKQGDGGMHMSLSALSTHKSSDNTEDKTNTEELSSI